MKGQQESKYLYKTIYMSIFIHTCVDSFSSYFRFKRVVHIFISPAIQRRNDNGISIIGLLPNTS